MKLITGMHRSGTSLVARLFYEAGADLGDPQTFYRPDRWNPEGYYEQVDIHAVNMPLINGPWGRLAYLHLPSGRTILRRSDRMGDRIEQTAGRYARRVVKETRFCLTLPAWLRHGAQVERILVCLRDPIQVARSLRRRNRIPIRLGLRLWEEHNRRLLEAAGSLPIRLIYYRNLLDPERSLAEIRGAFAFFGFASSEDDVKSLQQKCVRVRMNHFPEEQAVYPPRIQQVWRALRERHAQQEEGGSGDHE